jgi:PAS domain S-box-containing protein
VALESFRDVEPASGIEPPTCGLRNRCSTTELRRHGSVSEVGTQKDVILIRELLSSGQAIARVSWRPCRGLSYISFLRLVVGIKTHTPEYAVNQMPSQDDLNRLRSRVASSLSNTPSFPVLPPEVLEDLHVAFEELEVSHEELRAQADSLLEVSTALERERQRYQELFEFAPDGYLITDLDGAIREANNAAARLFDVDVMALTGKPLAVFIAKDHKNIFRSNLGRLRGASDETPRDWDVTMISRSNHPIPVSIRVARCRGKQGLPDTVRWLIRDVSSRKAAHKAVWERTEAFAALLEASPSAVISLDAAGHVAMWNLAAERLLGWQASDMLGKPLCLTEDVGEVAPKALHLWHDIHQFGWSSRAMERRLHNASGTPLEVSMSVSALFDSDGKITGCITILSDLTDRRRADSIERQSEDQLRQLLQRLELIREEERSRIARELHDEFGQALTALKFDLAGLTKELQSSRKPMALEKAKAMEGQISSLMNGVRRLSTELRPPILDHLGLGAAIEWQAAEFAKKTGIPCEADVTIEPVLSSEASTALLRIYQESLTNVARHARATQVRTHLRREGQHLLLSIMDNGLGLSLSQWNAATSLGLLGMRERAALIGATIRLDRPQNGGTLITLRLPL